MKEAHREIKIATEFGKYPAGRYESDGPYNGADFRRKFLEPALRDRIHLRIHLDGVRGYGSSFLEEAFGGLVRSGFERDLILDLLEFTSKKESLIIEITEYIKEAKPHE
jgi:hypothetical protein